MDEAQALAHCIAVMRAGEIIAAGTPTEIGGRAEAPSEIRFTLPAGVPPAQLPSLAAEVTWDGCEVLVVARDAVETANRISGWALEHAHELRGFSVARPSLEDIYLRLTGGAEEAIPS
jgi:ABC-2 type transport system ATP-binding protein